MWNERAVKAERREMQPQTGVYRKIGTSKEQETSAPLNQKPKIKVARDKVSVFFKPTGGSVS